MNTDDKPLSVDGHRERQIAKLGVPHTQKPQVPAEVSTVNIEMAESAVEVSTPDTGMAESVVARLKTVDYIYM